MAKRIPKSYLRLARSFRHNNKELHKYRDAQEALNGYIPWLKKRRRLVQKSTKHHRLSKATTTYYKEIRLGSGWPLLNDESKAYILVHEAVHVRQWDYYGRAKFGWRYITNAFFRWAMEVQGYREGIMWGVVVLKDRGLSDRQVRETLERKVESSVRSLLGRTYALGRISRGDLKKQTQTILREGIEWQLKNLARLSSGRPNG